MDFSFEKVNNDKCLQRKFYFFEVDNRRGKVFLFIFVC